VATERPPAPPHAHTSDAQATATNNWSISRAIDAAIDAATTSSIFSRSLARSRARRSRHDDDVDLAR